MKAAFLLVLLVAAVAAEEAVPLFSLDNFNDPEALRAIATAQEPTYTLCDANAAYPFAVENLLVQPTYTLCDANAAYPFAVENLLVQPTYTLCDANAAYPFAVENLLVQPTYTLCDANAAYPFAVENLLVQPFPLQKGKPATMILVGRAASTINLKQIKVTTKVQTVSINTRYISEAGKSLTGTARLSVDVTIPSYAPAGSYTIQLDIQDITGAEATCLNIPITLS
eukprot:CAMPEP_0114996164 /NCGR_PEP_ID=MMETSP0216-20121206/14150_1 /TAXON_ID=223996 /ORGANISM="Protocruzia adherens, Strain Boccale" /LENGTH=225 /DNA_ID=CAMNT_0002360321 /DNA_START=63 /DNA_END=740 /DNA_ORIENTATION=+